MDSGAIVLKNIRRDIPALKPLAAKVICLQRQLIRAVQRYQTLNLEAVKDEAALKDLLEEIFLLDQYQKEELNLVREAEDNYSSSQESSSLYCSEKFVNENLVAKVEEPPRIAETIPNTPLLGFRITGNEIIPKNVPPETKPPVIQPPEIQPPEIHSPEFPSIQPQEIQTISIQDATTEDESSDEDSSSSVMDWEDLTREHWSETDKLLQKIERVGSKVLQQDFMSSVDLVHVNNYKQAEESLRLKKLRTSQGRHISPGPWQIFDIPTKVTNRRCNYLASGLHVTVRQKDPQRSFMATAVDIGVKTRHHDSRGSSRTSSRASSPISSQADNRDAGANKHRKVKTRAAKSKKSMSPPTPTPPPKVVSPNPPTQSPNPPPPAPEEEKMENNDSIDEPCITYSLVDGLPHFELIFPAPPEATPTPISSSSSSRPTFTSPPASIVESEIEIIQNNHHRSSSDVPKSSKSGLKVKRPHRLSQTPVHGGKMARSSSDPPPATASTTRPDEGSISKCSKWIGDPHFNTHRTISHAPTNPLALMGIIELIPSDIRLKTVSEVSESKAPKLVSSVSAPKAATAPGPLPPKLTKANSHSAAPSPAAANKFIPILPNGPNLGNLRVVRFKDKSQISLLKSGSPAYVTTVKECLKQDKNMKVVFTKAPITQNTPADEAKTVAQPPPTKDPVNGDNSTPSATVILADMLG